MPSTQHRAGAAVALVAALLAAGEPEAVAQHFEQRPVRRRRDGEVGAVDVQHEDVEVGGHGSQEAGVLRRGIATRRCARTKGRDCSRAGASGAARRGGARVAWRASCMANRRVHRAARDPNRGSSCPVRGLRASSAAVDLTRSRRRPPRRRRRRRSGASRTSSPRRASISATRPATTSSARSSRTPDRASR